MRPHVKELVEIIARSLPIGEPIYEFGSLQAAGQKGFADLRSFFPDKEYVGCDMREGPGVDRILNLHDIDLPDESAGTVLCADTFEHVEYPRKAIQEIYRILKPDGLAVIISVMNFPIHSYPCDYWRFTPEAFKSLLKPFADSFVGFAGDKNFPHTVMGIGFKGRTPPLEELEAGYNRWQKEYAYFLDRLVIAWTPPVLHPVLSRVYRAMKKAGRRKKASS